MQIQTTYTLKMGSYLITQNFWDKENNCLTFRLI